MCGIIWAKSKDGNVNKTILKRYEAQKHRGSKGFGYVSIDKKGKVQQHVLTEEEHQIKSAIKDGQTSEMLFHHRFPTSTANLYEAAHPIEVDNDSLRYRYYVAHNGVISNSKELHEKHVKLGFSYSTELRKETRIITRDRKIEETVEIKFNDSESLAIELARYVEGQSKDIETRGTAAFIMQQIDRDTAEIVATFYGRNEGNPLYIERNKHMFVIKSDSKEGDEVEAGKIYRIDAKTSNVSLFSSVSIGYHYTYKKPDYQRDYDDYDYSRSSMGFTSQLPLQLPMRVEVKETKKAPTLDWSEMDEKDNAYIYLGDGNQAEHYEAIIADLTQEKRKLQRELKTINENIIVLKDVRNNEGYWDLLGEREGVEDDIRKVEYEIDKNLQEFYDNN